MTNDDELLKKLFFSGRTLPIALDPAPAAEPAETSATLSYMKAQGIPLTRENYLALNFPDAVPDPFPAELEMELPPEFRRW